MEASTVVSLVAVAVVLAALALTSPAVGPIDARGDAQSLGDGTASVDNVALEHDPVISPGRFGTDVAYLRVPDVTVQLSSVTGRSRVVYRVAVPALDFDRVADRPLAPDDGSARTVGMSDRAFAPETIRRDAYVATLTVRVQSFAADTTHYRSNVTVEVRADG